MTKDSNPSERSPNPPTKSPDGTRDAFSLLVLAAGVVILSSVFTRSMPGLWRSPLDPSWENIPAPLVKRGGDPYIRALMRTISASEASSARPYSLLYGGEHIEDLSEHPDRCITILAGPNLGDCTTAAGRYQFITTTWLEKAAAYHPNPNGFLAWRSYSFEPEYQDEVVYRWLSDSEVWGVSLKALLRDGQINEVLRILSPTWTSLGYGIETNDVSDELPEIYEQMLQQELGTAANPQ